MRRLAFLFAGLAALSLAGCERASLPFPTPAQNDLIVLVRSGPLTYGTNDEDKPVGLEHDLIEAFAEDLGVGVRYIVAPLEEIPTRLENGEAHFAAGWFSPGPGEDEKFSPPYFHSIDVIVQNDAALPINELADLRDRTVYVMPGARQAQTLRTLQASTPGLQVADYRDASVFELLEAVRNSHIDMAAIDNTQFEIAQQFIPDIQTSLAIGDIRPIAWMFGTKPNAELVNRAKSFIERIQNDGTLDRLRDRYFGHVRRLGPADIDKFMAMTATVLPKLRKFFQAAQETSGVDWRLIAALSYHESQWDANAVSPTGVRGIMMLTEDTADYLGVSNRLDVRESILAGARYVAMLKEQLLPTTPEPDRTWLALAAYNIGPGSFSAGRTLARELGSDADSWYEMKRVLPLLAQAKYYRKLRIGRARGGEAVILAENIRSYYDILTRLEPPFRPILAVAKKG